ncbi:MAG: alpha/beta hydrolase [Clostridiales bacterium]|jgi:pimeloyl-ACP methyl ester carboxylesterase|nr:alpha/beta hydrolase [Clostridiales bacterium]
MKDAKFLTLNDDDPRVAAAYAAERRLFEYYKLSYETRYITVCGVKIRLLEFGAGDPLLIVPGNTGDGFVFAPLLPHLKNKRVVLLNRPGGGLSDGLDHRLVGNMREFAVQTLIGVLDALNIEKLPVAAHSMGGHWSLWLASDRPERVTSLTLLGVPGNVLNTRPPFALRLAAVRGLNKIVFRAIVPKSKQTALKGLSFMGHSQNTVRSLPDEMSECYFRFQNLPHYAVSSLSLMESMSREYRISAAVLKTITQPVNLIWGENDSFGKVETGREIAKTLPNAAFHLVQGGGHLPWLDAPKECAKILLDGINA